MEINDTEAKSGPSLPERTGEMPLIRLTQLVRLNRTVYTAIRVHGEESYPYECCGALLGHPTPQGWRIEAAVQASNARTNSPRSSYEIAPAELVGIVRKARGLRLEIAGFYHSHPDHPADWSPTDLAEAHWLGCCYLITAVVQGKSTLTSSFLLAGATEEDRHFEWQTIQIDDEIASSDCV